jgi:subtilase family serine protease
MFPTRTARYLAVSVICLSALPAFAQRRLGPGIIQGTIQDDRRARMTGNVHPLAKVENDVGPVDSAEALAPVTLNFRQSPEQQAALDKLLLEQRDPASANYHRWLTPAEYADQFGATQDDIDKVSAWIAQQNLHVAAVAQSRTWISFTGTAGDIARTLPSKAFGASTISAWKRAPLAGLFTRPPAATTN